MTPEEIEYEALALMDGYISQYLWQSNRDDYAPEDYAAICEWIATQQARWRKRRKHLHARRHQ